MKYLSTGKGFPGGAKNLPANTGGIRDMGLIPGLRRSPGEGNDNPLQYSCLGNPTDRGVWQTMFHRVAKRWTQMKQLSMQTSDIKQYL